MPNPVASLYEAFGTSRDELAEAAKELCKDGLQSTAETSVTAARLVGTEMHRMLDSFLRELDVIELAVGGWLKISDLRKYRDKSKYPPSVATVVTLGTHTVQSEHRPKIEVLFDGQPLATLNLDLDFAAVFESLALTIQDARICRIGVGRCRAEVSLSYKKNKLWKKATSNVALPGTIDLGRGVPI